MRFSLNDILNQFAAFEKAVDLLQLNSLLILSSEIPL